MTTETTNYAAIGLLETLRAMQVRHEQAAREAVNGTAISTAYGLAIGYESAAAMVADALPRIIAEAIAAPSVMDGRHVDDDWDPRAPGLGY